MALIALKEDDFGVDANLQFCQHGPRVPRSLFRRAVAGVPQALTRAKVAEFFMENVSRSPSSPQSALGKHRRSSVAK